MYDEISESVKLLPSSLKRLEEKCEEIDNLILKPNKIQGFFGGLDLFNIGILTWKQLPTLILLVTVIFPL